MYTLNQTVESAFRLQKSQKSALKRLRIETLENLLYHFPTRYQEPVRNTKIKDIREGESVSVVVTIKNLDKKISFKGNLPMATALASDGTGSLHIAWFNQPYLAKMLTDNMLVRLTGKVTLKNKKLHMANPEVERGFEMNYHEDGSLFANGESRQSLFAVYPESKGITSRWMYHALKKIFADGILDRIEDPIPQRILKKYHLPSLHTALIWMHTPQKLSDSISARKRFAFEEVFMIQLAKLKERKERKEKNSYLIKPHTKDMTAFLNRFKFKPTLAQTKAIKTIMNDLQSPHAMSRLLEGDVGSGKTLVAATSIFAVTKTRPKNQDFGGLQTAYMVPTEILAKQQFASFIEFFNHLPINIGLITSSGCKKFPSKIDASSATDISRAQLLKWVANGEISIVIGTHSLIQKSVKFKDLAYIIIDEQHRFGTMQRSKLAHKDDFAPHLLSMSATPIPRTLALTIYGDLDITLLDEMPIGRKKIITEIVPTTKRAETYERVRGELNAGRQLYVICPRIEEPDPNKELALIAKSVIAEAERLRADIFSEFKIDTLHSKMTPRERDEIMSKFEKKETDILVATSVIEVGVNVPNATMIIIEGAERFGLAQLHQLRGRVIRSNHQAYCYILSNSKHPNSHARLKALAKAKTGFELAEHDLKLRGSGELYGRRQWGISDVGMEAIKNIKMVEAARLEASIILNNKDTDTHDELLKKADIKLKNLHFE